LTEPATVTGLVTRANRQITVNGQVNTRIEVECARCLKAVEVPVKTEFRLEYVTPQTYEATPAAELDGKDMALSVFDGQAIDIDELVDEQIMLALPSRVLCQEACKGLCPVCGGDRNVANCTCESTEIDPRWSVLRELVNGK
jgi:uncharacterized protein